MERSNANIIQNAFESMMTHHNRGNASFEEELKRKWSRLGNEISFAGVSAIYKYFKGELPKKQIEEITFIS